MLEAVTFWMDNKNCVGKTAAIIGDQALVLYRDRYYVLLGGAAQTRGGKFLKYSQTSLPPVWKRALKGEGQAATVLPAAFAAVPGTTLPKRERKKAEKPAMIEQKQEAAAEKSDQAADLPVKPIRKSEAKPAAQPPVVANCPYCTARHEIPLEKGRIGKPFFISCSKCQNEFAVRLVPVTIYQAQVAGFK